MILSADITNKAYPWLPGIKAGLSTIHMDKFNGTHLMIGSDYSGSHAQSKYLVYTFLIAEEERSYYWPRVRHEWRSAFLPDGRRLSFKALNDGVRRRSLQPFLCTFHYMFGCCVTIAVHKSYANMSGGETSLDYWRQTHGLSGQWRKAAFEQVMRTAHLFTILVGHFSQPQQDITWITDEDEIVANDNRLTDIMDLVAQFSKLHVPHKLGVFAMNTPAYFRNDRAWEDFVALPDLIAGALAEYLSVRSQKDDWQQPGELPLLPELLSPKTEFLCAWLEPTEMDSIARSLIVVDKVTDGYFRVKNLEFRN